MSTEFFWDEDLKERIFLRYVGDSEEAGKDLRYCFESVKDCISFFAVDKCRIIYDNDGVPYTVASLRIEIIKRGFIYFDQVTE